MLKNPAVQFIILVLIVIEGALLAVTTISLTFAAATLEREIYKNREVACINRHLSGDPTAPACREIIENYGDLR